jgi:hypothetical protein
MLLFSQAIDIDYIPDFVDDLGIDISIVVPHILMSIWNRSPYN